ncbi:probable acyl-CoA dehydrogenase 6 [Acanthaster planci]|uniref:Probable acyl-CoA dehydrogenase 6 n=1 Tax=Acanthaster planci TaxID=133434 RepID=A0A8B7XYP8_ACAPL|nr:probable acyl-CoA dehydrogenase 6 [Acanthaster planci]
MMATFLFRSSFTFRCACSLRLDARSLQIGIRKSSSQSELAGDRSDDTRHESIFTDQHVEMRRSLGKLIEKEINPYVDQWEAERQFPSHEVFKKLGEAGFLGLNKPTEYGGSGLDFSYSIAMAEELGNIKCGAIPMAIGVQSDMATPALARFGSDELRRQFLAPTIAGDVVACLGVSEVGSGSDVASIQTRAEKQGGDYVINGGKMWITNGIKADWICLLANTGDGPAHQNKSLICVPMDAKGVVRAQKIDKIGMWSSDTAQLFFEDVRVPQKNLIGQEGMGFTYQMLQFQEERMWAVAAALVPLEIMINETIAYTKQRKAFGKSILDNQVVHYRLAELQTEVELLRSLLYRTIGLYIHGVDVTKLASMGKLKTGRLCREVSDSCLQFWGGMGFTSEVLVSRFYRDFRLISIGGGADEVMLSIISKYMGTLPMPAMKK